jgi:hypothetical protein
VDNLRFFVDNPDQKSVDVRLAVDAALVTDRADLDQAGDQVTDVSLGATDETSQGRLARPADLFGPGEMQEDRVEPDVPGGEAGVEKDRVRELHEKLALQRNFMCCHEFTYCFL